MKYVRRLKWTALALPVAALALVAVAAFGSERPPEAQAFDFPAASPYFYAGPPPTGLPATVTDRYLTGWGTSAVGARPSVR